MITDLIPFKPSLINKLETWEDFISFGLVVRTWKDVSQWVLGDLARAVEKRYGEDSLGKYANDIKVNPKSLMEYRRVASRYPKRGDRIPYLSFSHHQRALKSSEPHKLLLMAHDNDWSIRQLERFLMLKKSADCEHEFEGYLICKKCGKKVKNNLPLDK